MAKTEKKAREKIGSGSFFLGCFGFSRNIYSDKPMEVDGGEKKKMKKKRTRWLLCSKFRLKNGEVKPAPIEEILKPSWRVENESDKQKPVPVISRKTDRKNIPAVDKAVNQETKETKPKDLRDKTTDRSKPMEPLISRREDTWTERISKSDHYGSRVEKFDPIIGISIIILTLMIMLIWGRLFAILCTSAWCYFLPRFRDAAAFAKRKRSGSDSAAYVSDLNSKSYKRKLGLDGFLGRQNRVSFF